MNVAILLWNIPDLSGGGGAERFFVDFVNDYALQRSKKFDLFIITDDDRFVYRIKKEMNQKLIIKIFDSKYFNFRFLSFLNKTPSYILGNILNSIKFFLKIKKHRISKIIVPLYNKRDYFLLYLLSLYGIKIDLFIVDCRIPFSYFDKEDPFHFKENYHSLFRNVKFDVIHTWYDYVADFIINKSLIKKYANIFVYNSRYLNNHETVFYGSKKNIIMYASRFDEHKDPFFFLRAIHILIKNNELDGWEIFMFGKGPLENEIIKYINENKMPIKVQSGIDLMDVFRRSRIYISTQKFENFPSRSIYEAIVTNNIVIAKKVGRTDLLVKNKINGFLFDEGSIDGLVMSIREAINTDESFFNYMNVFNKNLMDNEHNIQNFCTQFHIALRYL